MATTTLRLLDDTLARFLQELHDQTVLHADDLADAVKLAANGDAEARVRVVNGFAELAALLGLHLRPEGVRPADAMNEAILILSKTPPGPDFATRLARDIETTFQNMHW
jgi:hypothetical protein